MKTIDPIDDLLEDLEDLDTPVDISHPNRARTKRQPKPRNEDESSFHRWVEGRKGGSRHNRGRGRSRP